MKKNFLAFFVCFIAGAITYDCAIGRKMRGICRNKRKQYFKHKRFYKILIRWLKVRQEGRSLERFFLENDIHTVAIYGMRELGEALFEELSKSSVDVKYGIDRNADNIYAGIDVYLPEDELDDVDAVVVTVIQDFGLIENNLKNKMNCKVVSIEDVVWES